MKYTWEGYDMSGESCCGGYVYANSKSQAEDMIDETIENEYDDYVASGYSTYKIISVEKD